MSLAVLMLIEDKMYRLGLSEINDYFKLFKEEVDDDNPIKNFEKLIQEAIKLGATVTDERIDQIMTELGLQDTPAKTKTEPIKLRLEDRNP